MRVTGKAVVLGLLLAAGPILPVHAQEASPNAETESLQMYRVEVVIFEQLQSPGRAEDSERPPLPPPPAEQGSATPGIFVEQAQPIPQTPAADTAAGELPTPDTEPEPVFFEPVDMQDLADVARTLDRRPEYRVLAQEAWRQPGFAREESRAVDLATVERLKKLIADSAAATSTVSSAAVPPPPPGASSPALADATDLPFEATATLWLGRYLHLAIEAQATTETGAAHLDESRRMRSGEIHYFDSPRLGAVAVVVPEDTTEPLPEDVQPEGAQPAATGSL